MAMTTMEAGARDMETDPGARHAALAWTSTG
jgi:hypothetical protein